MSGRPAFNGVIPGIAGISVGHPGTPEPEGWRWIRLTELARLESGHTPSRKHSEYWRNGDIPWVSLPDARKHHGRVIHDTAQRTNELGLANSAARWLPQDTVCLSRTASVGYVFRLGRPMATSQDFVNWVCSDALDPRYLMYALIAEGDHILEFGKGTTHTTIYFPEVLAFHLCLAPLTEQRRIVEKVEALVARVNATRDGLASVSVILKRFRQSVLAAACSGRLTEDWREEQSGAQQSFDLLETIRTQRIRVLGPRREANVAPPNPNGVFEHPEAWVVTSIDELTLRVTSGSRDWKQFYAPNAPGTFVMAQNVRPLYFDRSYRHGVNPPVNDRDRERSAIRRGDLLVTIVGANTGDVCRVAEDIEQHYVCQSVALMRPVLPEMAQFLELWLNSPVHGQAQYNAWIYGEGRPHLSLDHLKETAVALPPLDEQAEIVQRADALLSLADAIERRVAAASSRADKMTQSILAKAFNGELVPTEAELARREGRDYESASALLERVRAQVFGANDSNNATSRASTKTRRGAKDKVVRLSKHVG